MRDTRYDTIKVLIESGLIQSFPDIFRYIPKTTVYKDLGVNFNRFSAAIYNPKRFTIGELFVLADMFEVDSKKLIDMAYEQALVYKKMREKRKSASPIMQSK